MPFENSFCISLPVLVRISRIYTPGFKCGNCNFVLYLPLLILLCLHQWNCKYLVQHQCWEVQKTGYAVSGICVVFWDCQNQIQKHRCCLKVFGFPVVYERPGHSLKVRLLPGHWCGQNRRIALLHSLKGDECSTAKGIFFSAFERTCRLDDISIRKVAK